MAQAAGGTESWGAEIEAQQGETKRPTKTKKSKRTADTTTPGNEARTLGFTGDKSRTFVKVALSREVPVEVFTLADPFRVIIELPDTTFPVAVQPGTNGKGLVETYHNGVFQAGKARIVLETLGPVRTTTFPLSPASDGNGKILEVALVSIPVAEFEGGTGAARAAAEKAASSLPDGVQSRPGAPPPARPVIVIDPGHGGIDPGAVGENMLLEKNIVLSVAQKLQNVLQQRQRYQVFMTRTEDVFVSLDQRLMESRKKTANLFISLHADSLEQSSGAHTVSGATVYTLSERASDEQARKMAEKENASDLLAGLASTEKDHDEVKGILIDLLKRETATFSAEFSGVLISKLKPKVQLSRDPRRSAAFKVLKQTHAPSVLVELGYMSNAADVERLNSPEWQTQFADAIATAVDAYFASRTATAR